jgi:histidinol-phosphate/aromatic aminotransferase/cobyric acid decarboxylase-like protein
MAEAASEVWKYGDPESHDLRHALAAHHGVGPENVMVGEGIDGLLGYLVRLLVGPGDAVVTSDGAYPTFNYHVAGFGGVLHKVPYSGDHEDPEALVARATEVGAKLIYLANPDNPMGTWHDAATIRAAIDGVPEGAVLVLDEAYVDFAPEGTAPPLDPADPRVIRMRTFSKAYGMAGARVGYAWGTRTSSTRSTGSATISAWRGSARPARWRPCATRTGWPMSWPEPPPPAPASPPSQPGTTLSPCPRPPTSSRSIAAATAHSPARS